MPLVGAIILLVFFCLDSCGPNSHGPSPKYGSGPPDPPFPSGYPQGYQQR